MNALCNKSEQSVCSICLDIVVDGSITTPCSHNFHIDCIKRILHPTCPMCKTNILKFLVDNNFIQQNNLNKKMKVFNEMIDFFFDFCDDDILCRRDFTCCNSCGMAEIYDEIEDEKNDDDEDQYNGYSGYIFYHTQTTSDILDQISRDQEEICANLNWDIFTKLQIKVDELDVTQPKYIDQQIESAVPESGSQIEYDTFAKRLCSLAEQFTYQTNNPDFELRIEYDQSMGSSKKLKLFAKIPESFYTNAK